MPPSLPYAQKFSNGSVWVEDLSRDLGLSITPKLALTKGADYSTAQKGVNFAFGGALSSNVNISDESFPAIAPDLPGFQEQVSEFISLSTAAEKAYQPSLGDDTLTVISVGANDYLAALDSPESLGELPLEALPNVVTDNIIDGIVRLSTTGAKDFLVVNIPALGETPLADSLDAQSGQKISVVLNQLSNAHNAQLSQKLNALSSSRPDLNIIPLDVNGLFAQITANPNAFNLSNTNAACLTNFQPGFQFEGVCENPDQFVFWDDVHPTAAMHQIVSDFALATLNEDG